MSYVMRASSLNHVTIHSKQNHRMHNSEHDAIQSIMAGKIDLSIHSLKSRENQLSKITTKLKKNLVPLLKICLVMTLLVPVSCEKDKNTNSPTITPLISSTTASISNAIEESVESMMNPTEETQSELTIEEKLGIALTTTEPSPNPSTASPSIVLSLSPSEFSSKIPSIQPSKESSLMPTSSSSMNPSMFPIAMPSNSPSQHPSTVPSENPSYSPTRIPSFTPSYGPTFRPTSVPLITSITCKDVKNIMNMKHPLRYTYALETVSDLTSKTVESLISSVEQRLLISLAAEVLPCTFDPQNKMTNNIDENNSQRRTLIKHSQIKNTRRLQQDKEKLVLISITSDPPDQISKSSEYYYVIIHFT